MMCVVHREGVEVVCELVRVFVSVLVLVLIGSV